MISSPILFRTFLSILILLIFSTLLIFSLPSIFLAEDKSLSELWHLKLPDAEQNIMSITSPESSHLLIHWWGTWCSFCEKEILWFERLSECLTKNHSPLSIVAIAIDDTESVKNFIYKHKISSLNIRMGDLKAITTLRKTFPDFQGLPVTLLINKNFELLDKKIGPYPSEEDLFKSIESLGYLCNKREKLLEDDS